MKHARQGKLQLNQPVMASRDLNLPPVPGIVERIERTKGGFGHQLEDVLIRFPSSRSASWFSTYAPDGKGTYEHVWI